MKTVDVGAVLDEGRWTGYQKLLVFGTALTIILDGVDNQLLPNTIPTLIKEWGLPRAAFINALASGPFGMMIGGLIGGVMGDRMGRRTALLASVITFGVLTIALMGGGAFGPWLTGVIHDATGSYRLAFVLAILCCVVSAIAIWIAAPRKVRLVYGRVPKPAM